MKLFEHQPQSEEGPVFNEPWQAQAFAITLSLQEAGLIDAAEWTDALASAIAEAQKAGDPDLGDSYYEHWLSALEALVQIKNLSSNEELDERVKAWRRAYLATPHGMPILLENANL